MKASSTGISVPRKGRTRPAERAEAKSRSSSSGKVPLLEDRPHHAADLPGRPKPLLASDKASDGAGPARGEGGVEDTDGGPAAIGRTTQEIRIGEVEIISILILPWRAPRR